MEITIDYIKNEIISNQGVFITGSAGTGKSTIIQKIKEDSIFENYYNTIYLGSTGIAAFNICGKTIHSFFNINPFAVSLYEQIKNSLKLFKKTCNSINNLQDTILVIDEVSMVSNMLLDTIDYILRKTLNNNKVFGGVKIVFVGDFLQLPPVFSIGDCYPENIQDYYENYDEHKLTDFKNLKLINMESCYYSFSWKKLNPKIVRLTKLHRFENTTDIQKEFICNLLELRKGTYNKKYWELFNKKIVNENETIKLTALKAEAQKINSYELKKIKKPIFILKYHIKNKDNIKVNNDIYAPLEEYKNIEVKENSKIILTKNIDINNGLINGTTGEIIEILYKDTNSNMLDAVNNKVKLKINFGKNIGIKIIEPQSYEITLYKNNSKNSFEENTQINKSKHTIIVKYFPIKLAYAITIHKSQGLTLDNVTIYGSKIFAPHQLYVALSRIKNPENLYIKSLPDKIPDINKELLLLYS